MPLTKGEAKKLLRAKIIESEGSINSMEEELMKNDEQFRKHVLSFHFGRLQQQFQEIYALLKDSQWI